jgi:hypothetical protein
VLTDNKRGPDEDNPLGYFEFEKATGLSKDGSWVPSARGKVVKLVAQLLPFLPADEYCQIILMKRDLREVIASQTAMLERQGRRRSGLDEAELARTYSDQMKRVVKALAARPRTRALVVDYAELLAEPEAGVGRIASFLGGSFNREAALAAVHPELRRQST